MFPTHLSSQAAKERNLKIEDQLRSLFGFGARRKKREAPGGGRTLNVTVNVDLDLSFGTVGQGEPAFQTYLDDFDPGSDYDKGFVNQTKHSLVLGSMRKF